MRNLFRRASFLFWQYPILWLPILIVDPLVLFLKLLDNKLTHAIILSVVTGHSVLGNTPESTTPTFFQTLKMLFLTKPIDWGAHLSALCLYACAMIATFTLISALRLKQKLSIGKVLYPLRQSFARLVFFSLKLLIAIGIAAIPLILLTIVFFQRNGGRFVSTENFGIALSTIFFSAIAYLIAPAALKLLRPQNSEALTPETTRQAKISAVLTFIASTVLYSLAERIKPSFILTSTPWSRAIIYEAVASLVSAAPYIILFIALSLLAGDGEPDSGLFGIGPELT